MTKEECEKVLNTLYLTNPNNMISFDNNGKYELLKQLINEHFEEFELNNRNALYDECGNCGSLISTEEDFNYCPYCGRKIVKGGKND